MLTKMLVDFYGPLLTVSKWFGVTDLIISFPSSLKNKDCQEQRLSFHPRCCVGLCRPCRGRCCQAELREVRTRRTGTLRARLISHRWTHGVIGPGRTDVRVGGLHANQACLQSLIPITTVHCVNMSISKIWIGNTIEFTITPFYMQTLTHSHTQITFHAFSQHLINNHHACF